MTRKLVCNSHSTGNDCSGDSRQCNARPGNRESILPKNITNILNKHQGLCRAPAQDLATESCLRAVLLQKASQIRVQNVHVSTLFNQEMAAIHVGMCVQCRIL